MNTYVLVEFSELTVCLVVSFPKLVDGDVSSDAMHVVSGLGPRGMVDFQHPTMFDGVRVKERSQSLDLFLLWNGQFFFGISGGWTCLAEHVNVIIDKRHEVQDVIQLVVLDDDDHGIGIVGRRGESKRIGRPFLEESLSFRCLGRE